MERSADGAWSTGLFPPPWWVERLNKARREAGQAELGRYDTQAMAIWAMACAPPPTSFVSITGC